MVCSHRPRPRARMPLSLPSAAAKDYNSPRKIAAKHGRHNASTRPLADAGALHSACARVQASTLGWRHAPRGHSCLPHGHPCCHAPAGSSIAMCRPCVISSHSAAAVASPSCSTARWPQRHTCRTAVLLVSALAQHDLDQRRRLTRAPPFLSAPTGLRQRALSNLSMAVLSPCSRASHSHSANRRPCTRVTRSLHNVNALSFQIHPYRARCARTSAPPPSAPCC